MKTLPNNPDDLVGCLIVVKGEHHWHEVKSIRWSGSSLLIRYETPDVMYEVVTGQVKEWMPNLKTVAPQPVELSIGDRVMLLTDKGAHETGLAGVVEVTGFSDLIGVRWDACRLDSVSFHPAEQLRRRPNPPSAHVSVNRHGGPDAVGWTVHCAECPTYAQDAAVWSSVATAQEQAIRHRDWHAGRS